MDPMGQITVNVAIKPGKVLADYGSKILTLDFFNLRMDRPELTIYFSLAPSYSQFQPQLRKALT